jgi:hypothetical protein
MMIEMGELTKKFIVAYKYSSTHYFQENEIKII